MNERQIRALIVGALVGAAVGGFYGVVLVTYRDMVAAQQHAPDEKRPCKACEEKARQEAARAAAAASPELSDAERIQEGSVRAEFISTAERARDIRSRHPEIKWQEAMHRAAAEKNGTPPTAQPESEEVAE